MITMPALGIGGTQGAPGGHRPPQRNCSATIGEWLDGSAATAAVIAGPQVKVGAGWNWLVSQITDGDDTGVGDPALGDPGAVEMQPATRSPAAATRDTTNFFIAGT